ncbi:MAG: carboxypeptidase regulatory-like domain-containing protein [Gemmatimonadaceae bacterium]
MVSRYRVRAWLAAALCLTPLVARAQIVRGRVSERGSRSAVGGVLVSLIHATTRAQSASTLSDPQGNYALRAPQSGSYHVEAKRIGVRRYLSAPLTLAAGETQRLDIVVEGLVYTLPEVIVSGLTPCTGVNADAPRIGALWEEARAALTATRISLRERRFRGTVSRYIRELDPRTRRVIKEEGREISGVMDKPFRAVDADSLSTRGYVITDENNDRVYHAPDADVLLSDAFVRDHCFRLAASSRERRGMMGLSFAPAAGRRLSDIAGTMWLDARTFELRLVEFHYVNIGDIPDDAVADGEVHFEKLANGAWVVHKWFVRLPHGARSSTPVTVSGGTPNVFVRRVGYTLREEGGNVTAQTMVARERRAGLTGTVHDSVGNPLTGAVVVLSGTPYKAVADATGTFRMDGIVPGTFNVLVEHPAYLALGVWAGESEVTLPEGLVSQLSLTAPRMREIRARLCPNSDAEYDRADLRVHLIDAAGKSVPFTWVRVTWNEITSMSAQQVRSRSHYAERETDQHGTTTFCGVPAHRMLPIFVLRGAEKRAVRADSVRLNEGDLVARDVRVP